jgi:AraC-like DNA-binding protein
VRVPFGALARLANVDTAAARRIARDTEALSLLRTYVANLPDRIDDPQLCRLASTHHVYDLMALAIGATDEGREMANQRSVRAARLESIKADLNQNATLHLDQLASRQRISVRYVQMLFEEQGTTFSDFVLERRLDSVIFRISIGASDGAI